MCLRSVRDAVREADDEDPIEVDAHKHHVNYVKLEGKDAETMLKLMEALEDHDDVQHVWANFDISEEEIASFSA